MKKAIITIAFAIIAVLSFAQSAPLGSRTQLVEVKEYNNVYSVFTYKDYYGSSEYDLSLGHNINELINEICIYLGITNDEAIDSIGYLIGMFSNGIGTTALFKCRVSTDSDKLSDYKNIKCMVVKRRILGKCISFQYETDNGTVETFMTKSSLKLLRNGLKER